MQPLVLLLASQQHVALHKRRLRKWVLACAPPVRNQQLLLTVDAGKLLARHACPAGCLAQAQLLQVGPQAAAAA